MQTAASERPSTWGETLAGVLIFFQFPLAYYLGGFFYQPETGLAQPGSLREIAQAMLFFGTWFVLPGAGFAIGWLKGFPRWAYPFAAASAFNAMALMNSSTPGVSLYGVFFFDGELWGLRACVPGLLAAAVVLLFTRSLRSLQAFFENGWKDWTRFTYAWFGFMPFLNFAAFDEIPDAYEMPYQLTLQIVMVVCAAAYLRSASQPTRILSLAAGYGLCLILDTVGPSLYWLENCCVDVPWAVTMAVAAFLAVFTPAIIGLHHRLSRQIQENP